MKKTDGILKIAFAGCFLSAGLMFSACSGGTQEAGTETPTVASAVTDAADMTETSAVTTDEPTETMPAADTAPETDPETLNETYPETETEMETEEAAVPMEANFTNEDIRNHTELPLFEDGKIPQHSEEINMIPTIAPYIVDGSDMCVVIFPGGGYFQRSDDSEGIQIARAYNDAGISAFVVRYRYNPKYPMSITYDGRAFLADAQRAVQFVRYYAGNFGVSRHKIAVCGFSAGGHLCMVLAQHADELYEGAETSPIGQYSAYPNAVILGYPVTTLGSGTHECMPINFLNEKREDADEIAKYSYGYAPAAMPATFIFTSRNDHMITVNKNAVALNTALTEAGVTVEFHKFKDGNHGIGLGLDYPEYATWHGLSVDFLHKIFG